MSDLLVTHLPKSEVKIEFTVSPDEVKPYLDEAIRELSASKPIPGFRPGMAGYEEAKHFYGEMRIWEHALERIVRALYVRTILTEKINTIGSPTVNVDQLTPGQPIKFHVIAPIEPTVMQFPDFAACKITRKEKETTDGHIDETIDDMRKMRRTEARVSRAASMDDLVMIDLEMKKDHVLLEGGTGKDYRVYLSEDHYIPGFTKELDGIKEGEQRAFKLSFPKEHFQKHLAGQEVEFVATAKGVFELQLPPKDDVFAKGVGMETLDKLRDRLRENIQMENRHRANEAAEIEVLEKLVDASRFSDLPDQLVNEEVRRMLRELEHGVEEQGLTWQDYLLSIKKTQDELRMQLAPQAIRRIHTAILIKQLVKQEDIATSEEEIDREVDRILAGIKPEDAETRAQITSADYREYVAVQMRNRKALEWLTERCVV